MHPKTIHKTHDFQSLVYGEPKLFNNIKEKKGLRDFYPWSSSLITQGIHPSGGPSSHLLAPWIFLVFSSLLVLLCSFDDLRICSPKTPKAWCLQVSTPKINCEVEMDDLEKKRLLAISSLSGRPLLEEKRESVSLLCLKKTLNRYNL